MPVRENREYRNLSNIDIAQETNEYIVEGYATTFNSPYTLWEDEDTVVQEQVDSNAFNGCDTSDVILQYDHEGRVFARTSNNTLQLTQDQHGLKVRADLSGTEIGRQLYSEIKGGYITKMSFGFIVDDEKTERVTETNSGAKNTVLRTIKHIKKLFDVSAVSIPANDQTQISSRKFSDGVIAEIRQELAEKEKRERQVKKIRIMLEVNK